MNVKELKGKFKSKGEQKRSDEQENSINNIRHGQIENASSSKVIYQ